MNDLAKGRKQLKGKCLFSQRAPAITVFRAVAVRFHPSLPECWVPACTEGTNGVEVTLHIIQAPLINLLTRETWDLQPTCGVLTPLVTRPLETKIPQSTSQIHSQTIQVSVLSQAGKSCGLQVLSRADDLAPRLWVQSFSSPVPFWGVSVFSMLRAIAVGSESYFLPPFVL